MKKILVLIFMVSLTLLLIPKNNLQAATGFKPQGITILRNNVIEDVFFQYSLDETYIYYDFGDNESIWGYTIEIVIDLLRPNTQFTTLKIGYDDFNIEIDTTKLDDESIYITRSNLYTTELYYTFYLEYDINNQTLAYSTILPIDSKLMFIDNEYDNSAVDFQRGYDTAWQELFYTRYWLGFTAGENLSQQQAYDDGYADALDDVNNDGLTAHGIDLEESYDYQYIYTWLYNNGFTNDEYSISYLNGYSAGLVASENDTQSLIDFIPGILGVLVGFILQLGSIQFLGISLLDILGAIVTILGGLLVFKLFFGK